jgi:flagellar biosynthesis/type III secretory pathway protein FliH
MPQQSLIAELHPKLFSRCTVTGPDDLAAELHAAGMTAAAWQVEALHEQIAELEQQILDDEEEHAKLLDAEVDDARREGRDDGLENGRIEIRKAAERHLEELDALIAGDGRITRAKLRAWADALAKAIE